MPNTAENRRSRLSARVLLRRRSRFSWPLSGRSSGRCPAGPVLRRRRVVTGFAGGTALAGVVVLCVTGPAYAGPAGTAVPAPSSAVVSLSTGPGPSASLSTSAGFGDCPALPAGVDAALWRCEVHTASPRLTIGKVSMTLAPITMTHAEGPLPDGTDGQVWGGMHGEPTPVPGGLTGTAAGDKGRLPGLALQAEYGGRSDFYTGRLSLRFRLRSPLLPRGCTIGASAPVDFRLKRSGPSTWLSTNPPLIAFSAYDDTFAAPAPEHCGPLSVLLAHRLGLPAPSGNLMTYDATYTFRTYDQLQPS